MKIPKQIQSLLIYTLGVVGTLVGVILLGGFR